MAKNKNKDNKKKNVEPIINKSYYTKFTEVHLAALGSIVLCKATTENGTTETFDWNKKSNRELIRSNTIPGANIIVEKNVPPDRGWNYV